MKNRNILLTLVITCLVLILIAWGFFIFNYIEFKKNDAFYGTLLNYEPYDFTLKDHNGNEVSLYNFKDKFVLLTFGYTNCPDICPTTLAKLDKIADKLDDDYEVQVLFITIDPTRDTAEKLKNYVPYFNENFIGLTGDEPDIYKAVRSFHAFYSKEEGESSASYIMNHTTSVFLIDQNGKNILKYSQGRLEPEGIISDLKKLL